MNKTKVNEIINFSFRKYFQNKWFIIFNIISLLSLVLTINWGNISEIFNINKDNYTIEVVDYQNCFFDDLSKLLENEEKLTLKQIDQNNYTADTIPKNLIVLEITKNDTNYFDTKFISKEGVTTESYNAIKNALKEIRNDYLEADYFLTETNLQKIRNNHP